MGRKEVNLEGIGWVLGKFGVFLPDYISSIKITDDYLSAFFADEYTNECAHQIRKA